MSWPLDGFEKAVQDAVKERLDRDDFNRKAIPEGKAALIEALQKFELGTKEYWDRYCRIVSENGYAYLAGTSYEHFNLSSTDTLHIIRDGGNVRFWAKQRSRSLSAITIFDISLEGDKVITEFNSEINVNILYYWKEQINNDLKDKYLERLIDRVKGAKHD